MKEYSKKIFIFVAVLFLLAGMLQGSTRLKNVSRVSGIRKQQLVGYGLVTGLSGTGDGQGVFFTVQSISNMLVKMGIKVNPDELKVKNVAAVMVTATLPPFAESGSTIDVTVSSLGDAKSLKGGALLRTPLQGPDGKMYAVAQGKVTIGGYSAGQGNVKNHLTTGTIASGGIIERDLSSSFVQDNKIRLIMERNDFTTTFSAAESINRYFSEKIATPIDGRTISVEIKDGFSPTKMLAFLEQIKVNVDGKAKIVLNERTGTVVMGGDIVVRQAAISHGNLTITVEKVPYVSQPSPFGAGETVEGEIEEVTVEEEKKNLSMLGEGRISDLVEGLNKLGVSPRDLVSILQALKRAGAIDAEIELM